MSESLYNSDMPLHPDRESPKAEPDVCPVCLRPIGSGLVDVFTVGDPGASPFLGLIHSACAPAVTRCHACGKDFSRGEERALRRQGGRLLAWHVDHEPADSPTERLWPTP